MQKNSGKAIKILVIILILLIILAGSMLAYKRWQNKEKLANQNKINNIQNNEQNNEQKQEIKEPKTFAGNERPIAFMIDNNINAMPQAGLKEADLIYEMIVEGGETRLMIVMKGKNPEKIGPLRSARHYFLDYALENDAIYVHYGQSPQAKSDIKTLAISDINGIYESEKYFWRDSTRYSPHNAVTSMTNIKKLIERENYRTTSRQGSVLNYTSEEIELEDIKTNNSIENTNINDNSSNANDNSLNEIENLANTVTIPYSANNVVRYEYDAKTKTYIRYSRNKKQVDWDTKEEITTKNIIITKCENTTIQDGSGKGRQTLDNVKTLDGYYITGGKYIKIKCEKTSRSGKTIYKDLEGKEIKVNDGKTFIQICPINSKIKFE